MKKYLFSAVLLLMALATFTACDSDNGGNLRPEIREYAAGMFVLNEGNYGNHINGSLSYVSFQQYDVTNNIFSAANNRSLGGTPNSMLIDYKNREVYIASSDENRVEIVDRQMVSVAFVSVQSPRELAQDENYVYVSGYSGTVTKISKETHQVVKTSAVVGTNLEGLAVRNGVIYVCTAWNPDYTYNNTLVKIDAETMTKLGDVTVAVNPTSIKAYGKNLYVLSTGDYGAVKSQVQKVDENDNVSYIGDATLFDVYKENVYAINVETNWTTGATTTTYTRYNSDGTTQTFAPSNEIYSPCGFSIDQTTGMIAVSSYKQSASGTTDWSAAGTIHLWGEGGTGFVTREVGVGPTSIVFNYAAYVEYVQ